MKRYNPIEIEEKWQKKWDESKLYEVKADSSKQKMYISGMFPYPSGAGLHTGHARSYTIVDSIARFYRQQGKNVLNPIGWDTFGLPAENYAIKTGISPQEATKTNIENFKKQFKRLGISIDWSREINTSSPEYYKWTQWIFIQLFHSWYNKANDRAECISTLVQHLEKHGTEGLFAAQSEALDFSAEQWKAYTETTKQEILLNYRMAYRAETTVNWCPALGTVLANDEVKDGKSERGGYPVFQKKMMQWSMRITAYSDRLLKGLEGLDWSEAVKESQRNWIGKSEGASVKFKVQGTEEYIEVFTTRPDTIFGVSFITLAPEHQLVKFITSPEQKQAVEEYIEATSKRSERERMADVKNISGVFTGAYAEHPITQEPIPIWLGDYVLAGYGTGAVMAVPCGDDRDYAFAQHFNISIKNIFDKDLSDGAYTNKEGMIYQNSDFLNGETDFNKATDTVLKYLESHNAGKRQTNYRQRDAIFSRQRYWGEPVPVYYEDGVPYTLPVSALPLELPEVEKYLPTEDGDPPLGKGRG